MDTDYDNDAALQALDDLRKSSTDSGVAYALQDLSPSEISSLFTIVKKERPTSWIVAHTGQTDRFEVVHRIRGVITSKCLPPFTQVPRTTHRARHMKQGIQLTGLGLPYFDNVVSNLLTIFSMFDRHFSENELEKWEVANCSHGPAIHANNRLFTPGHSMFDCEPVSVPAEWDPSGAIRRLVGSDLMFSDENVVMYYTLDNANVGKYIEDTPSKYRVGDIVEIQVTPTVTPVGQGRYRMFLILRSVALVNDTFSKSAIVTRGMLQVDRSTKSVAFKRVIGYASGKEDDGSANKKRRDSLPDEFCNMSIE